MLRTDQRLLHLERFRRERISTPKVRHLFERSNWPALPQISTAIGWPMHSKFVFVHFEAFESSFQLNSVQLLASRLETNCPFFIDCHSTSFFLRFIQSFSDGIISCRFTGRWKDVISFFPLPQFKSLKF